MNIGIIVHSQSGHTYNAALKLQEKLIRSKHKVTIEKLIPADKNPHPGIKNPRLETCPETGSYDGLIFAAPVWAFSLSPILASYLSGISSLKGKKIAAFVTMGSPWAWMGGNRAIRQIKQSCEAKGGMITAAEVVGRSGQDEKAVNHMVENLSGVF